MRPQHGVGRRGSVPLGHRKLLITYPLLTGSDTHFLPIHLGLFFLSLMESLAVRSTPFYNVYKVVKIHVHGEYIILYYLLFVYLKMTLSQSLL